MRIRASSIPRRARCRLWKQMEIGAGFFLKDVKELRRTLESGKATPTELSSKYGYVVNEFNDLVISYNNYQR
jgi:hypothetical protein